MRMTIGLILSSFFYAATAAAFPLPNGPRALIQIPASLTRSYDFEGIVQLSNCSGSLIRLENAKDSDLGLILTNGHCYEGGFLRPGEFISHRRDSRSFVLMDSQGNEAATVTAREVLYATMTKTDMTIYQLDQTYGEILAQTKVRAFTLSSQHPNLGQSIQVVSGYWQRGYSCSIEAFVHQLNEESWSFVDSIRYARPGCEVIGGTSGSPIILNGTRTVIGINNTGNESGEKCTQNNPCEIDADGSVTFHKGYSYGQETFWIYSCVDSTGTFNLATPGCVLPH